MSTKSSTILYTATDEAPALATYSLLPIVEAFTKAAGVAVEPRDISLVGRILALFPEALTEAQRIPDSLTELGELAKTPEANIIKLPNISASMPQLQGRDQGAAGQGLQASRTIPADAEHARGEVDQGALRQGQGQRGQPGAARGQLRPARAAVGQAVRAEAPALDGRVVARTRKTHVAHMSERRLLRQREVRVMRAAGAVKIELVAEDGSVTVLKEQIPLQAGEVIDATVMSMAGAARASSRRRSRTRRRRTCCSRCTSRRP